MSYKKGIRLTIFTITSALVLGGCASTGGTMSGEDRAALADISQVRVLYYGDPYPSIKTAGGVLASEVTIGLSTLGEDWTAGQKMMKKYDIPNPSRTIRDRFLRQIKREGNIKKFVGHNTPADYKTERKTEDLQAKYKTGVVLQIMPRTFQIWYYPTNWNRYQLWFKAWAQVVRLDDGKILWKGNCSADQKDKASAPTMKELTADNSVVLKNWVDKATRECSDQLAKSFLGKA